MNNDLFNINGQVAVITGGSGVLGSVLSSGLAAVGVKVAVLDLDQSKSEAVAEAINSAGGEAIGLAANVLDREILENARAAIVDRWGRIDILVNVAGGNMKGATIGPDQTFFDLSIEDLDKVMALNLKGTVLPTLVMSQTMAEQKSGCVINVSSMTAQRPWTRVMGYGISKAGIDNFTKWLAVEMNKKFGEGIRINAIAPGVFVGAQNRGLLYESEGVLSARGQTIVDHTPMGRFGEPEELLGTIIYLASPAAYFVTGVVIPIDGGMSAFAGV